MKTRWIGGVVVLLTLAAGLLAAPREAEWKQVEEAARNGLPQTAIGLLEPIITGAIADQAHAEAIRAIAQKVVLEADLQDNADVARIVRLQAALETSPDAMKPAMEALLAYWYWQYFQNNHWEISRRTRLVSGSGPDIQTWDFARLLAEIDRHFTSALAAEALLKTTPVGEYHPLLTQGNVPDKYRPTLYDFIAHEALDFYQAQESVAFAEEEHAFEFTADSPIFAPVDEFVNWNPQTGDPASPLLKAIRLFQALLKFHAADADRSAYDDVDLARLTFGHTCAVGDDKDARYKAALQRFAEATQDPDVSSRAYAALADLLIDEGKPAQAHVLALKGRKRFGSLAGAAMCESLIQRIEAKEADIETEHVWNAPWPTIDVTYRNITRLHFRAIAIDFIDDLAGDVDEEKLFSQKPALAWEAELPPTPDFKERTEKLPAPTSLKPGYYLIAASHNPSFSQGDNQVSFARVWVSDLALVVRTSDSKASQGGLLFRANSGEPVAGATVRFLKECGPHPLDVMPPTETDENGRFEYASHDQPFVILAEHEGQSIAASRVYAYHRGGRDGSDTQTVFFTDRVLYRPGQTIHYKGVSLRHNRDAGKYSVLDDHKVTVVFKDSSDKEIARATHRTNDYGSFSGVFTAPRDRLPGRMSIEVLNRPGSTTIRVEEYKRPKFQVELNAPAEAAKLGAPVVLTGKATAYTGSAIGGAKVKWRVERSATLPPWCWWWRPPAIKPIAHGTAITEADGTFKVQFIAEPDRSVPEKNEPTFAFSLIADVTDTTGETRSAERTVQAGYTALQATLSADAWQTPDKPVALAIATRSLDGEPLPANGKVTIYALQQPASVARAPLERNRHRWHTESDERMADPANPDSWELGNVVAESTFTTDAAGTAQLAVPLKAGIYRADIASTDRFGKPVTARCTVQVVDPTSRTFGIKRASHVSSPRWSVEPGATFTALWGTGYDQGRAYVELECNGKPLQRYWTKAGQTQELISQPVTEAMRGGFTLRITYVRENRAYTHERVVTVPWTNKQLTVKWESFRSKLTPGQKETWTAVVTGADAKRAAAEMVAALYDASLDQYQLHGWPRGLAVFRTEAKTVRTEFQNDMSLFQDLYHWKPISDRDVDWSYRAFAGFVDFEEVVTLGMVRVSGVREGNAGSAHGRRQQVASADAFGEGVPGMVGEFLKPTGVSVSYGDIVQSCPPPPPPHFDLPKITTRKNLGETAFFLPHLLAGDDGVVRMTFTLPEALTEWKFLGFAHDKQLRSGLLTDKVVTAKDLMVDPIPRASCAKAT